MSRRAAQRILQMGRLDTLVRGVFRTATLSLLLAGGAGCEAHLSAERQACVECALREHADPSTLPDAEKQFTTWCAEGDARSCSALAVMYESGRGVARDEARAAQLFGDACRAGVVRACVSLGSMMERGTAARVDPEGARTMYEAACHLRALDTRAGLAGCYALGRALAASGDIPRAADVLGDACRVGHAPSCDTLGVMARAGRGVTRDEARARALFERACRGGHTDACSRL